jgi:hypothetical protein
MFFTCFWQEESTKSEVYDELITDYGCLLWLINGEYLHSITCVLSRATRFPCISALIALNLH